MIYCLHLQGGKGVRVVDCVLSLKSFSETKQIGRPASFKYGGIIKPSMSGKYFIRKNSEPFMKAMMRSHSAELLQDGVSLEQTLGLDFSLEHAETVCICLYISYFLLAKFLYFVVIFILLIVDYFRLHQNACSNNTLR